jgi:hypothetical protein
MTEEELPDLHRNPEWAAEMAVNAVLRYLSECGVEGEDNKRQWINRVCEMAIARQFSN